MSRRKKKGKRRVKLLTRAHAAFGVLLEGHPFSIGVCLLHILFISVCSDCRLLLNNSGTCPS